jgi:hypothetical protein
MMEVRLTLEEAFILFRRLRVDVRRLELDPMRRDQIAMFAA